MSQDEDQISRVLQRIASDSVRNKIVDSYNDPGAVLKEMGTPSNNMLLSIIHAESKRSADIVARIESKLNRLEQSIVKVTEGIDRLCELSAVQNTIMSSYCNSVEDSRVHGSPPSIKRSIVPIDTSAWYYQGTKLTSKYRICACIVSHLIELVRLRMENKGIYYPDSVDANFTTLEYCVRDSSKMRCSISTVKFKNEIDIPDTSRSSTAYDSILPLIASHEPSGATTLPETRLAELSTPLTRPIMESIARIVERVCYIERLLSPQQIDILKSLRFPIVRQDADGDVELNWNESSIVPRVSHPTSVVVTGFTPGVKSMFIKNIMRGQNISQACVTAQNPSR